MILLGVILLIVAVLCIAFGLALTAVKFLLWIGVGLVVIGVVVVLYERFGRNRVG